MTRSAERIDLICTSPGTDRYLTVQRYGTPGARPKAYLQAAIHADEIPAMMALHHLRPMLDAADKAGQIKGEIVVVPVANPVGLAQNLAGYHLGRFDLISRENFNRNFLDVATGIAEQVRPLLTDDATRNVEIIREAALAWIDAQGPRNENESLKFTLLKLAIDADTSLDLHCAGEASMHLFIHEDCFNEGGADLSAQIGSIATLVSKHSSGARAFSQAVGAIWGDLREKLADTGKPIPTACMSATVEYRGRTDVTDAFAKPDAENLFKVLQRRGVIAGDPGPVPAPLCTPAPVSAMEVGYAPKTGVLTYHKNPGDVVKAGDVICEIIDPMAEDQTKARTPVKTLADGVMFGRRPDRVARPGMVIFRIASDKPLPHRLNRPALDD